MSDIKFLLNFSQGGDLKKTIAELKSLNTELQKNEGLQKKFGDSFSTSTKTVASNLDEIAKKTRAASDAMKVTSDAKEIARLTKEIESLRKEYDKLSKSTNDMLINNEKLAQSQQKTEQQVIKTKQQKIKLQQQEEKQAKKLAQEQTKLNSIYAMESARLNDLRKRYKDMALSTGTASKESRTLLREITALDKKLKGVDASVGQFQRNVGNYGGALKSFGGNITSLLGIGSGVMLVQDAFKSFAGFQQGLGDLSALTGLEMGGAEMEFLKQSSLDLAKTSTASASEVLEAYKLIGSAQPELLKDVKALDKMTQSTIVLSDASGVELPEAATALTNIMNQLGLKVDDVDRAINVLAAGAKEGSAEIPDLSAAFLEAGVSMKAANIEIEEGTGLIEALADRGIKGSEAGTKLRNVITKLNAADVLPEEALKQLEAAGVNMELLSDKTLPFTDRLKELNKIQGNSAALVKVFGLENQDAASILIDSTKRIDDLTKAVTGTNEAYEQAEKRTGTVGQEFEKLKNTFEALVIEFIDGGGDFASTLKFIRENLETILKVTFEVVKAYALFKTTMFTINAAMKLGQIGATAYSMAMSLVGKSVKGADEGVKSLNASMKANVIGLVVVAVYELADALGFFESQVEALEDRLDGIANVYNRAKEIDNEVFDAKISAMKKRHQEELDLTKEQDKEFVLLRQRGELRTAYQKESNAILANIQERKININRINKQIIEDEKKLAEAKTKVSGGGGISGTGGVSSDEVIRISQEITKNKELIEVHKIKLQADQASNQKYVEGIRDLNHEEKKLDFEATQNEIKNNKKTVTSKKETTEEKLKDMTEYYRKIAELQAENIIDEEDSEIRKERIRNQFAQQDIEAQFEEERRKIAASSKTDEEKRVLLSENRQLETQLIIETEEDSQNKITEIRKRHLDERNQKELDDKEKYLAEQLELFDYELKQEEINALNSAKTKEEIEILLLEKKAELLEKEILLRQEAGEKTIDQELELARLRQQIADATAGKSKKKTKEQLDEELKMWREFTKDTIDLSLGAAEKKIESNIDAIEKEISAQEENIDRQRELAAQGLDNTLAFEKQIQAEKEARLIEEQKRLEKIKKVETYFNLLSSYAQEDPNSAPAKALVQMGIAEAIAARFEDGGIVSDEVAKQNGGILQGASHRNGGILIEAEGSEGIFSKKEMKNLGKDNFYALKNALNKPIEGNAMQRQNESMMAILPQQRMMVDFSKLERKVDKLITVTENKPVPRFTIDRNGNMITETETKKLIHKTVQKRKRI